MRAEPAAGTSAGRAGLSTHQQEAFGLLSLGGIEVALPLSALREVVPCPAQLSAVAVQADGMLGVMELRTLVVPVLDLRPGLGVSAERHDGQVVVVLAFGTQVLGVLADTVHGVLRVPAADLLPVQPQHAPLLLSHTFRHPEKGGVVSVLDPAAVLRTSQVPTVHGQAPAQQAPAASSSRTGGTRKLTLLRCGAYVFGVDVADVHSTVPGGDETPSLLSSALCRGVLPYAGRAEVPVVDPLALLGLGTLADEDVAVGLVLELPNGFVVFALTELLDIVEVDADQVLPVPPFALPRPELVVGVLVDERAGQCLVLAADHLRAEPELRALAALNSSPVADLPAAGPAATAPGLGAPRLTYRAGTDVTTPLGQITEIIPLPGTQTRTHPGSAFLGVLVHRDCAVPVMWLAALLGLPVAPPTAASCVLLVEVDGSPVAFAVEQLGAIDRLAWQDPAHGASGPASELSGIVHACPLVQVHGDTRLLPELDLVQVARLVCDGAATPWAPVERAAA